MTIVINLFAGPSAGKTTVASGLTTELKLMGKSVELIHEFMKEWAYLERIPSKFDQMYILGQQSYRESILYNRVDYIVTDSPLLLIPFYEQFIIGEEIVKDSVSKFMKFAEKNDVQYINFWLTRPDSYEDAGRYQTLEEAIEIDNKMLKWLDNIGLDMVILEKNHHDRIAKILEKLNIGIK